MLPSIFFGRPHTIFSMPCLSQSAFKYAKSASSPHLVISTPASTCAAGFQAPFQCASHQPHDLGLQCPFLPFESSRYPRDNLLRQLIAVQPRTGFTGAIESFSDISQVAGEDIAYKLIGEWPTLFCRIARQLNKPQALVSPYLWSEDPVVDLCCSS